MWESNGWSGPIDGPRTEPRGSGYPQPGVRSVHLDATNRTCLQFGDCRPIENHTCSNVTMNANAYTSFLLTQLVVVQTRSPSMLKN